MNIVSDIIDCIYDDHPVFQWIFHDVNSLRKMIKEFLR